jgi:phage gpG-like protein
MKNNGFIKITNELIKFVKRAPRIAGNYAVGHFQDNIRKRGGIPENGRVQKFKPRMYTMRSQAGKKILYQTGNLTDSILIVSTSNTSVTVGISDPSIKKYAMAHQDGATIAVTPQMKKYFWAQFYKAGGKNAGLTKKGAASKSAKNVAIRSDAQFWKNMALKETGSTIKIPQRQFMKITPDVLKGIRREFIYEINQILANR